MTRAEILLYEIRASWWANLIGDQRLQDFAGKYFAWKVNRKYRRYERWESVERRLQNRERV